MAVVALVSFLLFALTIERGWVGNYIAYSSLGISLGCALAEGLKRSLYQLNVVNIVFSFAPVLFLFSPHIYGLNFVSEVYYGTIFLTTLLGFFIWTLYVFENFCNRVVEGMNDFTQHISRGG